MGIFFGGILWFLVDFIRISPKDALLLWEVTIKSTGPLEANHGLLVFIIILFSSGKINGCCRLTLLEIYLF